MEELTSEVTDLELGQRTPATVAMSLLARLLEPVRTMDNGLEVHQLVKVSFSFFYLPQQQWLVVITCKTPYLVLCPTLSNPPNGRVSQRGNTPGARALYTCNSDYELVGLSSRTCQNNGQWSGDAPTCESKPCHWGALYMYY